MLQIEYSNAFKKDLKLLRKRGKDINKFKTVADFLINEQPLPQKYRDHSLLGNYIKHREFYIEPDWLLIYRVIDGTIIFEKTGTHSDLF